MTRLSNLLANRPSASTAVGARFYATDTEQVYFSTGNQWVPKNALDEGDANGQIGGENLAARPEANTCIGFIWSDAETGNQYEAFPNAWALINDLTPTPAIAWKKFRVTVDMIDTGTVDSGGSLFIPLFTAAPMTSILDAVIAPVEVFTQDPGADPQLVGVDDIDVGADFRDAEENLIGLINTDGYADGPEILTDPDYIAKAGGTGTTAQALAFIKTSQVVSASITLPSQDEINPPVLADYQKLITGAFDIWLLISKLPV